MAAPSQLPFRPLEYWKPPKAVLHIRARSTNLPQRSPSVYSFDSEKGKESFDSVERKHTTYSSATEIMKNQFVEGTGEFERQDGVGRKWYDVKGWGKKVWIGVAAAVVILIIVIVVPVVVTNKKNKYPDYSRLSYSVSETYSGENFFDNFDYFTGYDPSSGFVHYVDSVAAAQYNLTYASTSSAVLRVDTSVNSSSVPNASTGRFSVRITSKKQYGTNNLFIFDVKHTPTGCATWPALWLSDPSNWPTNGEIDIMEAVNVVSDTQNQMTLHTTKGCSMDVKRKDTGTDLQSSCLNSTNGNAGCGVDAGTSTFGNTFNNNGGGVMAMELRTAGIRMWQFARASIPSDISAGSPDPSTWPEATADFPNTNCDIDTHFRNQSIIANIDLCGSWAGDETIYAQSCPGTCSDYVANNNTAFANAYWEFGSFVVYSANGTVS
ncbi:Concanavalin A-like lectins/glucanase [Glarea lozoyensis ATCC 20868]|uniref:endo-1,3(4)-beta-glucanase n=1 Tax=Glarea lozoyensis (strain ATCC 20868 / MF5171) TaxID=1116229 RepID=S3DME6_GLAL2|nr:Concanavalin A-like lectins/glucanase [Glarea lozoyensis ATCC 20868]EPE33256.1 Concanavalin A-like lectins/glucanase [Glarea lozoyensis ATCC 20868]